MNNPPKHILSFFRWFCHPDLVKYIEGDLVELFEEQVKEKGIKKARWLFTWEVVKLFRPSIIRPTEGTYRMNQYGLIKSYFKIAVRSLMKNRAPALISILGFAVTIGCTINVFLYADFANNLDSFHSNRENIYQIISHVEEEGEPLLYGPSPMLLGEHIASDHSDVRYAVRMQYAQGNVRVESQVFAERLMFVDSEFLSMFDFPIEQGDKTALKEKTGIVLSDEIATKYFGNEDPMGRQITINYAGGIRQSFYISGVFAPMPENASFKPSIVVPISNYFDFVANTLSWSDETNATFVLLRKDSDPLILNNLMADYRKSQNASQPKYSVSQFELMQLHDAGDKAELITHPVSYGNSPTDNDGSKIVCFLMLALACFNYLNIAVSSASKRLKEIALRKVVGSSQRQIMHQFLIENSIIIGLSIILGGILSYYLFLPGLNSLSGINVVFGFSSWEYSISFYLGIWMLVTLVSGAYPAFFISRFRPSVIFSGRKKFSNRNKFSRALLTLQLFIGFTTIIGSLVFTDNAMYVKSLSWGYDPVDVMTIQLDDSRNFPHLEHTAKNSSAILSSGGSRGHIGVEDRLIDFEYLDKKFSIVAYDVSLGYLETLKIKLLEGRLFDDKDGLMEASNLVVNEAFVLKMGWTEPIGQQLIFEGKRRSIIGVVENVTHSHNAMEIKSPMIFSSEQEQNYNYLTLKYDRSQLAAVDEMLKSSFHDLAPDSPYKRIYQGEIFTRFYENVNANTSVLIFIATMAILLSCLGLYGLVAYDVQRRAKEFGIRKIMGAATINIIRIAAKEYTWILFIAFVLGVPIGTLLIQDAVAGLLHVSKPFSFYPVFIAIGIILFSIVITVFGEGLKVSRINPVENLKDE